MMDGVIAVIEMHPVVESASKITGMVVNRIRIGVLVLHITGADHRHEAECLRQKDNVQAFFRVEPPQAANKSVYAHSPRTHRPGVTQVRNSASLAHSIAGGESQTTGVEVQTFAALHVLVL